MPLRRKPGRCFWIPICMNCILQNHHCTNHLLLWVFIWVTCACSIPQLFSHEKACKIRCWHSLPYYLFFGSFQIKNWNYSIFSHIWTKRVLKVCLKCELIWKLVIDIINKWCCITGNQFWQVFIRIFVYTKLGTYLPFHFVLLHLYVYLLLNEKCMCAIKFWVGRY